MQIDYTLLNECIICLDSNDTRNPIIDLNTVNKPCDCSSPIHYKCLKKWYRYKAICPICRKSNRRQRHTNRRVLSQDIESQDIESQHIESQHIESQDIEERDYTLVCCSPCSYILCFFIIFIFMLMHKQRFRPPNI